MTEERVDLSYLDDEYTETEVPEQDFSPIPDGKYQINVDRVELGTAQSSGNPMLTWTLRILGPAFKDRILWKNSVLISGTLQYVKKDLHTCGVQIQKLSDLPDHLEDLLDIKLEIVKKSKNGSENVYFNKLISGASEDNYQRASQEAKTPF